MTPANAIKYLIDFISEGCNSDNDTRPDSDSVL